MKQFFSLLFSSGIGFLLSGINDSYNDWSQQVFEGKDAKFDWNFVPDFSPEGFEKYYIGTGYTSPLSELLSLLLFGAGKNSYMNLVLQYILRFFSDSNNKNSSKEEKDN